MNPFGHTWGPYGPHMVPIWAHIGPYGPHMGRIWAPKEFPTWLPTWPPKSLQNRTEDDVKMQLLEKLIFATHPIRNARCCFPKGLPKRSKCIQKQLGVLLHFQLLNNPSQLQFLISSWLPCGPPKAPPRGIQGLLKITLGSVLGHLSCKFQFWASDGVSPGRVLLDI